MDYYRDSKIKPLVSDRGDFRSKDSLEVLVKAARKGGWKTGDEISNTILDKKRATERVCFRGAARYLGTPGRDS